MIRFAQNRTPKLTNGTQNLLPWASYGVYPESKVHGANVGPIWVLSAPGRPHVGPINLALRGILLINCILLNKYFKQKWTWKDHVGWLLCSLTLNVNKRVLMLVKASHKMQIHVHIFYLDNILHRRSLSYTPNVHLNGELGLYNVSFLCHHRPLPQWNKEEVTDHHWANLRRFIEWKCWGFAWSYWILLNGDKSALVKIRCQASL